MGNPIKLLCSLLVRQSIILNVIANLVWYSMVQVEAIKKIGPYIGRSWIDENM